MVIVNKLYMLMLVVQQQQQQQQQQKKTLFVEALCMLSQQKNLQILDLKG